MFIIFKYLKRLDSFKTVPQVSDITIWRNEWLCCIACQDGQDGVWGKSTTVLLIILSGHKQTNKQTYNLPSPVGSELEISK